MREAPQKVAQLGSYRFVDQFARVVEDMTGARHHQSPAEPRACAQSSECGEARRLAPSLVPKGPGEAPITATGRLPNTLGMSAEGRDIQSMAFLNTPGIPLLNSGVTSSKPSQAITCALRS